MRRILKLSVLPCLGSVDLSLCHSCSCISLASRQFLFFSISQPTSASKTVSHSKPGNLCVVDNMEELQKKHRQEQKELQSRITQKKKSATKKTRKGVNDECSELERQLKERQASELTLVNGFPAANHQNLDDLSPGVPDENLLTSDAQSIENSLCTPIVSSTPATTSNGPKKPSRQKARLARRAAEHEAEIKQAENEAANLPNQREQEIQAMREAYTSRNLKEHDIRSDGHCLYAAVADQLVDAGLGLEPSIAFEIDYTNEAAYVVTRQVAASYISRHPDDFAPFLEMPLKEYVQIIRETGEWGGHLEILALATAYRVDINVLHGDGQVDKIGSGVSSEREPLWLAYYRHSYGLGEHYNSLRRIQ